MRERERKNYKKILYKTVKPSYAVVIKYFTPYALYNIVHV
jgi:hypothetical protein